MSEKSIRSSYDNERKGNKTIVHVFCWFIIENGSFSFVDNFYFCRKSFLNLLILEHHNAILHSSTT